MATNAEVDVTTLRRALRTRLEAAADGFGRTAMGEDEHGALTFDAGDSATEEHLRAMVDALDRGWAELFEMLDQWGSM